MADGAWRELERRWDQDPGDQETLRRLLAARQRAGAPPSRRLLDGQVEPGRELTTRHTWRVWAQLPEGEVIEVGSTPRWLGGPLRVPEHRQWWVEPLVAPNDASMAALVDELVREDVPGLELPAGRVTDVGFAQLSRASGLRTLYVKSGRHLSDQSAKHLAALGGLVRLRLWGCTGFSDAAARALSGLLGLSALELPGSDLGDEGAGHLARLTGLTELGLLSSGIGDAGLARLADLRGLASLDLDVAPRVTDDGVRHLAALQALVKLNLQGCRQVGDAGVLALRALPELSLLVVGRGVSERAVDELRAARPGCVVTRTWDRASWSHWRWDRPLVR